MVTALCLTKRSWLIKTGACKQKRMSMRAPILKEKQLVRMAEYLRVLEHHCQAVRRIRGVHRYEGASGLENAHHCHNVVQRARQHQAHGHLGANAQRNQPVRQLVGVPVQLAVA